MVDTSAGSPLVNEIEETLTEVVSTLLLGVLESTYISAVLLTGFYVIDALEGKNARPLCERHVLAFSAGVDSG